jgi:ligand-binding SRPBCC domain-containing protein
MNRFEYSFIVKRRIEDVWKLYTDINHLKIITPPEIAIKIESDTPITEGAEIKLSGKLVRSSSWKARIAYCRPYEYVDEMVDGPFRTWKHLHRFISQNDGTQVYDVVDYELPFGLLGKLVDRIYVRMKIRRIFEYRRRATINALENPE